MTSVDQKPETQQESEQSKDIRRMKSIPEQNYNKLLEYLATKPYQEVAPHIAALGRALDTNVEVVPD